MEILLLSDIATIFGLAIAVIFICHRLRIPVIVAALCHNADIVKEVLMEADRGGRG